jgi:AraC-like DNA-binding protein
LSQKLFNLSHLTVRAASLRGFAALLAVHGLSAAAMLREVGLPVDAEHDPDSRLPVAAVNALLELAASRSGLDDFGLRLAEQRGFSNLGPLTALARDEPDIRSALQMLIAFLPLHNDALEIRIQEAGDLVLLAVELHDPGFAPVVQATDIAVAMLCRILQTLFGTEWTPQMVCFERARPARLQKAQDMFGIRPMYEQTFSGLVLLRADLDRPNSRAELGLKPYMAALKEQFVSAGGQLVPRVQSLVGMLLPTGRCKATVVASQLGLSRRSLDRALAAEGTSFQAILDAVRREIALRQVLQRRRRLTDIAVSTGFQSLSAFSSWFASSFGRCPREARKSPG